MVGDFKCIELVLILEQKGGREGLANDNDDGRNRKNDKISNRTVHYLTFVMTIVVLQQIYIYKSATYLNRDL